MFQTRNETYSLENIKTVSAIYHLYLSFTPSYLSTNVNFSNIHSTDLFKETIAKQIMENTYVVVTITVTSES